jgi:hypothetical protein
MENAQQGGAESASGQDKGRREGQGMKDVG